MNAVVYWLTGVKPPKASPDALRSLATTWEAVRRAAVTCGAEASDAISHVLDHNRDAATDAFAAYTSGPDSSRGQLGLLADAALATRDAHTSAAGTVESTRTAMDAVAATTARNLLKVSLLPMPWAHQQRARLIAQATQHLTALVTAAAVGVRATYAAVNLPSTLMMSEAEARGSIPPDVAEAWRNMSDEERMDLLDAMAEDVMSGWEDDAHRPEITYYSTAEPQPPGTERPPVPRADWEKWAGYNGAAMGGDVFINYDRLGDNPTLMHTMVHELQHVHQGNMKDKYAEYLNSDPQLIDDVRAGRRTDPFIEHGTTLDEVERWQVEYQGSDKPGYYHQPTETDARRSGTEYLDDLTPEKMEELLP